MSVSATIHAKNESVKSGHDSYEEVENSQNLLEEDESAFDDLCHDSDLVNDHLPGELPFFVEPSSNLLGTPLSIDSDPEFDSRLSDFCEVKIGTLCLHH